MTNKTIAQQFIDAIQTTSVPVLKQLIQREHKKHQRNQHTAPHFMYSTINEGLPKSGITPLMVACKAYSVHYNDASLKETFEQMTALLLKAGADPYVQAGIGDEAFNAITVCNGAMPKCLRAKMEQHVETRGTAVHDTNVEAIREKRQAMRGMSEARFHAYV